MKRDEWVSCLIYHKLLFWMESFLNYLFHTNNDRINEEGEPWAHTSVFRTAALAVKNVLLTALGDGQKVAAVCAEDEGSDSSHCCFLVSRYGLCRDGGLSGSVLSDRFSVVFAVKQFNSIWKGTTRFTTGPARRSMGRQTIAIDWGAGKFGTLPVLVAAGKAWQRKRQRQ